MAGGLDQMIFSNNFQKNLFWDSMMPGLCEKAAQFTLSLFFRNLSDPWVLLESDGNPVSLTGQQHIHWCHSVELSEEKEKKCKES